MININKQTCLCGCGPLQTLTLDIPINDLNEVGVYVDGVLKDNDCIEWSYSMDGVVWSCWMSLSNALDILYETETDYYVRTKVDGTITKVTYSGEETIEYSTILTPCFDFNNTKSSPNTYNPYAGLDNTLKLYNKLSDNVIDMFGIQIYYFKLSPNIDSADLTFKEYTLMDVEDVKQIKMMITDGQMPSSKPEFTEWGFDFSADWEVEISKSTFATAFGNTAIPLEGDLIYVPLMKRMWMVNGAYEDKSNGFMWQSTTFKLALTKYQDKGSVDLSDTQAFVDSLVSKKYEDLFGIDENVQAGIETTASPERALTNLYNVFESDAIRKYVTMSDGYQMLNSRLINYPIYNKGILVGENMYDWSDVIKDSYIIYQKGWCGDEGSISFLFKFIQRPFKGDIIKLGNINVSLHIGDMSGQLTILDTYDSDYLKPDTLYFIYIRWSRTMGLLDINCIEQETPQNMPVYLLSPLHYRFNLDNPISRPYKFDIELVKDTEQEVSIHSFPGQFTSFKVYNSYIDTNTELLQMYPTNRHLLINDVANKFVELPGMLKK